MTYCIQHRSEIGHGNDILLIFDIAEESHMRMKLPLRRLGSCLAGFGFVETVARIAVLPAEVLPFDAHLLD